MATRIEPFGYFRLVELDHWEDCSSKDEGAVALYEQSVVDSLLLKIASLQESLKILKENNHAE